MRTHETWMWFFLKSKCFGIFMDYLLLHTGFLISFSQPCPCSKSCSHLCRAAEHVSSQGQETCTSDNNIPWPCSGCSTPTALLTTQEKWRFVPMGRPYLCHMLCCGGRNYPVGFNLLNKSKWQRSALSLLPHRMKYVILQQNQAKKLE